MKAEANKEDRIQARSNCWRALLLICGAMFFSPLGTLAQGRGPTPYENRVQGSAAQETPAELESVALTEKTGQTIPLDLRFTDHTGRSVALRDLMVDGKPILLSPVYFSCTTLCNYHLDAVLAGLKGLDWTLGEHFNAVAVSFDHRETTELAQRKHEAYVRAYGRPEAAKGWTFLTGDEASIQKLLSSLGFAYKLIPDTNEWSHASSAILVNANGKIMRYLPGLIFEPRDLKLAVTEAAEGKVGTFIDQMVLFCFKYNPHLSRYTLYAFNLMKLGGALMVAILMLWLIPFWLRNRREAAG